MLWIWRLQEPFIRYKHDMVKPEIADEHVIEFEDGRNLQVEDMIKQKGKTYCPVSLSAQGRRDTDNRRKHGRQDNFP